MGEIRERIAEWDAVDAALAESLILSGSASRRIVQSMINVAMQQGGGSGGGVSGTERPTLVAVRRRAPADEAAPTATNWGPRPAGWGAVFAIGAAPAPADAWPGDMHFLPPRGAGNTITTSFALADGSAWPQPWATTRLPAGGALVVQSGAGLMRTGAAGNYNRSDAVAVRFGDTATDTDVRFAFRFTTPEPYLSFVARSPEASLDLSNGVVVGISTQYVRGATVSAYTYTDSGQAAKSHTVGVDYGCRVSVTGTVLSVRTWPLADPEPTAWDFTATIPGGTAGYQGLVLGSGAAAARQEVLIDDATFTVDASGYGSAYGVAYGIS